MSEKPIIKMVKRQWVPSKCPLTVVIPVRNLHWMRLINCLKSIKLQTLKKPEIIISDYGSSKEAFKELMKAAKPFPCNVLRYPTKTVWSLSIARNMGIRRAHGSHVVTIDADLILEPKVLETVLSLHRKNHEALVVSMVRNLRPTNLNNIKLPQDYNRLRKQCSTPRPGIGGLMSATRKWWHKVRGFDERMKGWGAEDDDIRKRAKLNGKTVIYLQHQKIPQTKVFHQWHPKPYLIKSKQITAKKYGELAAVNRKIYSGYGTVIRNNASWGVYKI